jgi:hypothetical protein
VAIVVLSVVVTMMASIFRSSQSAWKQGAEQNEIETAGRVALNLLTRELQTAVADHTLTFQMRQDRHADVSSSYGFTNSELCLIAFQEIPTRTNRMARAIMYWVQEMTNAAGRYELIRGYHTLDTASLNCYTNEYWSEEPPLGFGRPSVESSDIVAQNISGFRLSAKDLTGTLSREYSSRSCAGLLPTFVDIYLELLTEREAKQAADLIARGIDPTDFVEKGARRFTTRVYFYNRIGYGMP